MVILCKRMCHDNFSINHSTLSTNSSPSDTGTVDEKVLPSSNAQSLYFLAQHPSVLNLQLQVSVCRFAFPEVNIAHWSHVWSSSLYQAHLVVDVSFVGTSVHVNKDTSLTKGRSQPYTNMYTNALEVSAPISILGYYCNIVQCTLPQILIMMSMKRMLMPLAGCTNYSRIAQCDKGGEKAVAKEAWHLCRRHLQQIPSSEAT